MRTPLITCCQSGFDAKKIQAIVEHPDDQGPDDGPINRANATGQTRAADDRGGDGVQFVGDAGRRLTGR